MVDPLMAHLMGNLIQKVKIQLRLTSIVVTHDMQIAEKLADRVLFLHEGKAEFFGSVAQLRQTADPVLAEGTTDPYPVVCRAFTAPGSNMRRR